MILTHPGTRKSTDRIPDTEVNEDLASRSLSTKALATSAGIRFFFAYSPRIAGNQVPLLDFSRVRHEISDDEGDGFEADEEVNEI